ncbi:MAG: exo-alpha-sialidase, partial [Thermoplasmata archaeon]
MVPPPTGVEALPTPGSNVPIQPGPTDDRNPSLAVGAGGILHVVRTENRSSPRGAYYSRSSDGLSWSPTLRVDGATGNVSFSKIVVERESVAVQGRTYIAYQTEAGPNADLWFVSSDDGVAWAAPRRIDSAPPSNASITPSIAATMGRLYAAWADNRDPSVYHVYFRASVDGGATWRPEVQLSTSAVSNLQPRIDAKGDTIVVAWRQLFSTGPSVAAARSEDGGITWTFSTVSSVGTSGNIFAPDVFVDDLLVAHLA